MRTMQGIEQELRIMEQQLKELEVQRLALLRRAEALSMDLLTAIGEVRRLQEAADLAPKPPASP